MERNEGDQHEHKHQNTEDKREYQEVKGKTGGEELEVGARASWAKELGPEQGDDWRTDHHDHEANVHGPCHEAHVTSTKWLGQ